MGKAWAYVLLLGVLLAGAPSCSHRAKVIPRAKFAEVYADLFLGDVWMTFNPDVKAKADTSRFYEYVLNSRGYTTEDYLRSVDYYMNDPDRYAKILKQTRAILDREERAIRKAAQAEADKEEMFLKIQSYNPDFLLYDTLFEEEVIPDTIFIKTDEYGRMLPEPVLPDSLWRGPGMTVSRDTVKAVSGDSLKTTLKRIPKIMIDQPES